jgi:hypothetical protein
MVCRKTVIAHEKTSPALLETQVKSLTPFFCIPSIRNSGIPHSPNPEIEIIQDNSTK